VLEAQRSQLYGDDPLWDAVAETVEWTKDFGGGHWEPTGSRDESFLFAWADGRTEWASGGGPIVLMTMTFNSLFPNGRAQSLRRHPGAEFDGEPLRESYARWDPPPRWIGRLRIHHDLEENEPALETRCFTSFVVVEPPAPLQGRPPKLAPTFERLHGSLEATGGWLDELAAPPAPPRATAGSGKLRDLFRSARRGR
jgi:hypothetical protein